MKVLLTNGSPHEKGCTYTALEEVARTLNEEGVETEIYWIGTEPLAGCIACGHCEEKGLCVFQDSVNEFLEKAEKADGYIFASPVHYAGAGGAVTSFMDRVFFAEMCSGRRIFYLKPAAAVVSARRGGTTAAFDQINKYFTISQMPIVSSCYWNMVHGSSPDNVRKDLEGMQIMRALARNMAWLLKCIKTAAGAGLEMPKTEKKVYTNFIREDRG